MRVRVPVSYFAVAFGSNQSYSPMLKTFNWMFNEILKKFQLTENRTRRLQVKEDDSDGCH